MGISHGSYVLGKVLSDFPFIILYSFVYSVSFFTVAAPASNFSDFYAIIL